MRRIVVITILLAFAYWGFYLFFQSDSIYGGDGGDLVTAAYLGGIPHPPGYPLYTYLAHLLTKVPFGSVAWRVSLLSSFPLALSAMLLFILLRRLIKSTLIAFIGSLLIVTNYVVWLFAIVPEVYGLHTLLIMLQILFLYEFKARRSVLFLYFFLFTFALSLTHHPAVWFFTPGYLYWLYRNRKLISYKKKSTLIIMFVYFILGLTPYIYIPIAASSNPALSWENPVTLKNFTDLVTLNYYGSFQSSAHGWSLFSSRLLSAWSFVVFLANDFSLLGIILMVVGMYTMYKKDKDSFIFIALLLLFSGPLLLFYAVFAIESFTEYSVVEQFLIIPYFLCIVFFSFGVVGVVDSFVRFVTKKYKNVIVAIFVIFPMLFFYINYHKLYSLKHDATAERLAEDILSTPEEEKPSLILLFGDTNLFNTQYVYYTSRDLYKNIQIIHADKIYLSDKYRSNFNVVYPDIIFPSSEETSQDALLSKFVEENKDAYDIYITAALPISNGTWIPEGLLVKYYPDHAKPDIEFIKNRHDKLWDSYQDPLSGSLGVYKNLALSDAAYYYEFAHVRVVDYYLKSKNFQEAIKHIDKAILYNPANSDYYYLRSIGYFGLNECEQSQESVSTAINLMGASSKKIEYYTFLSKIYYDCFNDEEKAAEIQMEIEKLRSEIETPLSEL